MSEYAQGFGDGFREAAKQLRDAAYDHKTMASESKKVLEIQAHELAAALFYSWANGFELNADGFGSSEKVAQQICKDAQEEGL